MIQVIAIDLDDTLIAPDKQIPQENIAALQAARDAGVRVVVATARGWFRTEAVYRVLQLDTPVIVSSGARIVDGVTGESMMTRELPYAFAKEVATFCDELQIASRVYLPQEIWVNDPSLMVYGLGHEQYVAKIGTRLLDAPYQIYARGQRETDLLVERFGLSGEGYSCNIVTYYDGIPEVCILHPQSTKGQALSTLCEQWGVPPEAVMALGDSSNDLPMIEWAGIGVAMGWAPEHVRERADMVTAPDNPAGVAEAIYHVLEQGKRGEETCNNSIPTYDE